ncbi:FadR/GntR family transcriptional regulator [Sinorhizobium americanum]|uniref:GntR family transcriptional regulator n=1 Tax=Sinorhizobium americanum TaxID=194963 RepID=A0A1L3LUD2_9HYPH|nr:GntR family transcriptional regulator [Sinorhizobium americanum]APG93663.1 GntR family transcriptional regulator [Sinorhizobium americanum]
MKLFSPTTLMVRGTIREAVRVLVSEGLLETRQGSGTYVCCPAAAPLEKNLRHYSLRDKREVLGAIYKQAVSLAVRRSTPSQIQEIRGALAQPHRGDPPHAKHTIPTCTVA